MTDLDLANLNTEFEEAHPKAILKWAWDRFGNDVAATSSFQTQSIPLLHMISEVVPELRILFLDTGFHFPETLAFRDSLTHLFGLNVESLTSQLGRDGFRHRHGELYRRDPDLCCYLNKVEPLNLAKAKLSAWITGIRRDQTPQRRNTPIIARTQAGLYKICPLATWTRKEIWRYIHDYDLPEHPLLKEGYLSVGCAPCTRPVTVGEDPRAGRWSGQDKLECGLHVDLSVDQVTALGKGKDNDKPH